MTVKCKQSDVFHCDLPRRKQGTKKNSSYGCHLLFYSILWDIHMTVSSKGFAIMCVRREACKIKGFWRKAADWILQGTADKSVPSPGAAGASAYDFHFFPSKWGSIPGKKGQTAVGSMHTWAWGTGVVWERSPVTWQAQIYTWGVQEQAVMHTSTIPPAVPLLQGNAGCVSRGAAGMARSHSTKTH